MTGPSFRFWKYSAIDWLFVTALVIEFFMIVVAVFMFIHAVHRVWP